LSAPQEFIYPALQSFHLFVLFQQNCHHNGLKRPWTCDHDPGLYMQLRAVKQAIEHALIGFGKRFFEGDPAASFLFDEGAERRQCLAHGMIL
jgi:hypothetical protein